MIKLVDYDNLPVSSDVIRMLCDADYISSYEPEIDRLMSEFLGEQIEPLRRQFFVVYV